MKSSFESVIAGSDQSFLVRRFEESKFSAPYHHHPEYELTLIMQGKGIRYVGNRMHNYSSGDLVLLGPDLPHCWKTAADQQKKSVSIVIHFRHEFMGADFFEKPEMKQIAALLRQSQAGLQFPPDLRGHTEIFTSLLKQEDPFKRWVMFLELLHQLSITRKLQSIDKQFAKTVLAGADMERINRITAHIVANFQQKISLKKAATAVNMTPTALCRYFKKITRKTFIQAVNDYRIDFAVNKLAESEKSIAEIGYESGFNDLSNFNKMFRQRINLSPLQYRKKFRRQT